MNVNELFRLAQWFGEQYPTLNNLYAALLQPIQHNANNNNKLPIEPEMEAVANFLREMKSASLSLEQLAILNEQGVQSFLGQQGAVFVESVVRTSDFDPETAFQKLQFAQAAIQNTQRVFQAYTDALQNLGVDLQQFEPEDGTIVIRVGFRRNAAINNVADLKNSSLDWYDILRGLSLAAKEAPESTRVVGAGTGSIILYLVATALVTSLLARISKHVLSIVQDILSIESTIEDLRQKKYYTKGIELELNQQIQDRKATTVGTIMDEVKTTIPEIDGEATNAMEKAIQKLVSFNQKGGDIDFVEPGESDGSDENQTAATSAAIAAARILIREHQAIRDEVRRLTDGRENHPRE